MPYLLSGKSRNRGNSRHIWSKGVFAYDKYGTKKSRHGCLRGPRNSLVRNCIFYTYAETPGEFP